VIAAAPQRLWFSAEIQVYKLKIFSHILGVRLRRKDFGFRPTSCISSVFYWDFKRKIPILKRFTFRAYQQKEYGTAKTVTFKKAPFFLFFAGDCGCAAKPWVAVEICIEFGLRPRRKAVSFAAQFQVYKLSFLAGIL